MKEQQQSHLFCAWSGVALIASLVPASVTLAHPLSGQALKFQQLPMDTTPIDGALFWGHDELSTSWGDHSTGIYGNNAADPSEFMADDFADTLSTPVVHVKWWGSYLQNQTFNHVQKFLISFESDVPAQPGGWSYPGQPMLNQVVTPGALTTGSGTFTETPISPGGPPLNERLFEYNAELALPFNQQPDTVYWLKIVALVDPNSDGAIQWGWHNRDFTQQNLTASPNVSPGERMLGMSPGQTVPIWHFQDDAIAGRIAFIDLNSPGIAFQQPVATFVPQNYVDLYDGPQGINAYSKDLAFELYTVPEPAGVSLLSFGAVLLLRRRRRTD